MNWSPYRIMWAFVFFDLPVETKLQRYQYSRFRRFLLKEGFTMLQYSIYIRHCVSHEALQSYMKKVEKRLPTYGIVSILPVTDKQFGLIKHFYGAAKAELPDQPQQLALF